MFCNFNGCLPDFKITGQRLHQSIAGQVKQMLFFLGTDTNPNGILENFCTQKCVLIYTHNYNKC